ncbi:hypothetical protein BDV19DRAFT_181427 [Aspergillus venezuelensis]
MRTCVICLSRSLDIQISANQRWASKPAFSAYDMARTWRALEKDTEFVKCINPRCCYGQLHAGGPDPGVVCRACGTRTCFNHRNMPWHDGLTCAEYDATGYQRMVGENWITGLASQDDRQFASQELLNRRTIEGITRARPGCHVATEKAGGCKYMRCAMCWREWCWDCGVFWRPEHLNVECSMF